MRASCAPITRRRSGRLDHDGVAGDQRGARHAGEDRQRKVPGGDHRRHAARLVAQVVDLAGQRGPGAAARRGAAPRARSTRESRWPRPTSASASRMVLPASRVSSAASSASSPRMISAARNSTAARSRAAVSRQRREGARARPARRPRSRAGRRPRPRPPRGPAGPGRSTPPCATPRRSRPPIEQRLVARPAGRDLAQRLQGRAAALEPGEVGVRHVGERAGRGGVGRRDQRQVRRRLVDAGRRRRRGDQLLDVGALGEGAAQERLVGGVLEQAAHEVGHAGNELADRRVLAQAQAHGAHRRLDGVAHAVQHLDLEAVVGHAAGGGRWRWPPRASARCGCAKAGRTTSTLSSMRRARRSKETSAVGLVGEDRRGPALLAGEHRLVVPVGALDEPHRERPAAAAPPVDQRLEVVAGVAQVGLHDHAGLVEGAELLFVEQFGEDRVGEVAVAELLEVEIDEGAALRRAAHDRAQRVFDGGRPNRESRAGRSASTAR